MPTAGRLAWTVLAPAKIRNQSRSPPGRQATTDRTGPPLRQPCPNLASSRRMNPLVQGAGEGLRAARSKASLCVARFRPRRQGAAQPRSSLPC